MRILEEALAALGGEEAVRRAHVMARLATELCWTAEPARTDALSHEAVALARQAGDPGTLAYALLGRILCASGPDHLDERAGLIAEILARSEQTGDREVAVNALMWRIGDALQRGDQAAMRADMAALIQHVEALRQPADRWMIPTVHSQEALLAGHFADAEAFVGDILAEPVRLANAAQVASALMFLVRREQGRLAELEAGLKGLVYQYPDVSVWRASLAWLYAELGRPAEARVQFDGLAGDGLGRIRRDLTWPYTMACLAEACAASGAVEDAVRSTMRCCPTPPQRRRRSLLLSRTGRVLPRPAGDTARALGRCGAAFRRCDAADRRVRGAAAPGARPVRAGAHAPGPRRRGRSAGGGRGGRRRRSPSPGRSACRRCASASRRCAPTAKAGAAPASTASALLRCEGDFWTLGHAGKVSRLRDSKGLRYLARLLGDPGREFHVLDLAAGGDVRASGARGQYAPARAGRRRARRARQARLSEPARRPARRARGGGGPQRPRPRRGSAARDRRAHRAARRAVGLGGRDRAVGAVAERARSSVTKALRHAIRLIGANDPALSRLLTQTVRTGRTAATSRRPRPPCAGSYSEPYEPR